MHTQLYQPIGILDELSVKEVAWLIEGFIDYQKDDYEMIANTIKVAGMSIVSGKDMKLFEDEKKEVEAEENPLTIEEQRKEDLKYLEETFGEL